MFPLSHDQYRAGSIAHHSLGRAADQPARRAGSAVCAQNNQINIVVSGGSNNLIVRTCAVADDGR